MLYVEYGGRQVKVYDTIAILATDREIHEVVENSATYNIFFGKTLDECYDSALMAGYLRDNCYEIFIGVKHDNSTEAIGE